MKLRSENIIAFAEHIILFHYYFIAYVFKINDEIYIKETV